MEHLTATPASNTTRKPIIHAYVKRQDSEKFILCTQTGNALPVLHSEHYSFSEAKEEAKTLGAVNCRLV